MYPTDKDIDLYIEGKLGESEKKKFEELLNEDKDLTEKVELRKSILKSLKNLAARDKNISDFQQLGKELLEKKSEEEYLIEAEKIITENNFEDLIEPDKLQEVQSYSDDKEKKSWKLSPQWLISIAAVIVILLIVIFNPNSDKPISYQEFAQNQEYFSKEDNKRKSFEKGEKNPETSNNVLVDSALVFYDQGKFDMAGGMFEMLLEKDSLNDKIRFYNGVLLMETEKNEQAKEQFELILSLDYSLFKDKALRNLIKIYLLEEDIDNVKKYLCLYIDKDSSYRYLKSKMEELASKLNIPCD